MEAIQKEIATFNREPQCPEKYIEPPNEVLSKGLECTLQEMSTNITQEMKTTSKTESLVVINKNFLDI
jgi:hypothetical protein